MLQPNHGCDVHLLSFLDEVQESSNVCLHFRLTETTVQTIDTAIGRCAERKEVTKDDRQIGLCTTASQQQAAVIAMRRELLSQQPMLLGYRTMWHRSVELLCGDFARLYFF